MNTTNDIGAASRTGQVNWLLELDQAITHGDEARLWHAMANLPDQDAATRELADKMPRLAYQQRGKVRLCELFMVPVLTGGDAPELFADQRTWKEAANCIMDAVGSWFGRTKSSLTMFPLIRPYDWLGTWKPHVLRSHLIAAMPGHRAAAKTEFLTQAIELPVAAPRLGFITFVATTTGGWVRLPEPDALVDERFKLVVSSILHRSPDVNAPTVLTPERVQFAVADGLCLWLDRLHQGVGITAWTVALHESSPDILRVSLELDDVSLRYTQFLARKHQVGVDGLEQLFSKLAQIAPMLDKPMDAPARQTRVVLDLT
jgi:hypothetical protein